MPAGIRQPQSVQAEPAIYAPAIRARRLQFISTRLVTSIFAGSYRSVFRGRGIEFEELRDYQPGDDIRSIDWNVTAKTGHPCIKRFVEEREMTVMLMLDRSSSLSGPAGVRPKCEVAAEICALLAGTALRSKDRVGLLTFGKSVEQYIPPGKGVRHIRRVISEIAGTTAPAGDTDLSGALDYLRRVSRRPVILFIVSDFICGDYRRALTAVALRNDVVAVKIDDTLDYGLPATGLLQLADPETGKRHIIDCSSDSLRCAYSKQYDQHHASTRNIISASGADLLRVDTSTPPEQALTLFFKNRQLRLSAHR